MKDIYKFNLVKNKSLTYIMPLINEQINLEKDGFLVNSYISYKDNDDIFCLMYKWSSDPDFLKYEGKLMSNHLYVGHADFGEKVVYKFELTHTMKRCRDLFIEGKYKDFSDNHKKVILDYIKKKGYNNVTKITNILDKNNSIKSDPPNIDLETVNKQISKSIIKTEPFYESN